MSEKFITLCMEKSSCCQKFWMCCNDFSPVLCLSSIREVLVLEGKGIPFASCASGINSCMVTVCVFEAGCKQGYDIQIITAWRERSEGKYHAWSRRVIILSSDPLLKSD